MAFIKYSDKAELKVCLQNAKESEDIFNYVEDVEIIETMLAMLEYSGVIYINQNEFNLLGSYR